MESRGTEVVCLSHSSLFHFHLLSIIVSLNRRKATGGVKRMKEQCLWFKILNLQEGTFSLRSNSATMSPTIRSIKVDDSSVSGDSIVPKNYTSLSPSNSSLSVSCFGNVITGETKRKRAEGQF